jgi:hypothetical protein
MAEDKTQFELFLEFIESGQMASILEEEIFQALSESLTGATREEILQIAREQAARLIKDIESGTAQGIADIIANGLRDQKGIPGIAKDLREMIGLNPQRIQAVNKYRDELEKSGKYTKEQIDKLVSKFAEKQHRERAELIANNEMRRAMSEGEKQVMQSRGAQYKTWQTHADSKVSDGCEANQAQGPIPIDEPFQSGHDTPPRFPGCRCTVSFLFDEVQLDSARERARERERKTEEAKSA